MSEQDDAETYQYAVQILATSEEQAEGLRTRFLRQGYHPKTLEVVSLKDVE